MDRPNFKELFEGMFAPKPIKLGEVVTSLTDEEVDFIKELTVESHALDSAFRVALDDHRKAMKELERKRQAGFDAIRQRVGTELWPKGLEVVFNTDTRAVHKQG